MQQMKVSEDCINLVSKFEGFSGKAYKCPAGVWTIGYGHTEGVKPNDTITQEKAKELLNEELNSFSERVASMLITATQSQFDALVSFAYNLGTGALRGSTLLKLHNAGKYTEAKAEFGKWTRAAGVVLNGLVKRRAAEAELYGR